ncbi:hypothetical protein [Solicola sp. PLA-1-18]|uniref:hypothetical protein n=1 Tax=Solicola sp. PLA-1-18 TaxID=3380532 RepID=UPI003B7805B7
MKITWIVWWAVWASATAAGLLAAALETPAASWVVAGALGTAAAAWARWVLVPPSTNVPPTSTWATALGLGASSCVALVGSVAAGGSWGVCYLVVLLLGGLTAMARRPGHAPPAAEPSTSATRSVDADQDALRMVVRTWTYDQLRWAWQVSIHRTRHPDPLLRLQTATQRQILLDEIERRDPAAFVEWFSSEPPAGSAPSRRRPGRDAA